MRLTTVGTGTATPSERVNSGQYVEAGSVRLLLDCGSGVVHRMATVGADWMGITHLAITHFHPDHTLDIPTLAFAWRYGALPPRSAPLEIIGPVGIAGLIDKLVAIYGDTVRAPGIDVTVREIAPGAPIDLGDGVELECRSVPHTEESIAYSIRHGGHRLVYTGDTGLDLAVGEWAHGTDVLLTECSLPEWLGIPTHLTPQRCAELAASAEPRLLALTHFYPVVEREDIRGIIAARWDGAVALTTDGWTIDIEDA